MLIKWNILIINFNSFVCLKPGCNPQKLLLLQHVWRKLPQHSAPYRFGIYSATFGHCHDSCCCRTCHLHTHTHTRARTHSTTSACVVYIGSTWPTNDWLSCRLHGSVYTARGTARGAARRLIRRPLDMALAHNLASNWGNTMLLVLAEPGFVSVSLAEARRSAAGGGRSIVYKKYLQPKCI